MAQNSSSSSSSAGMGCGGFLAALLTVLFVGLKLTGFIHWSWFWIISPIPLYIVTILLISGFFLGGAVVITGAVVGIGALINYHERKKLIERQRLGIKPEEKSVKGRIIR